MRWFLNLRNKNIDDEQEYQEALSKNISRLPEEYQYAFDNEQEFVKSKLGFCGHCNTILTRPTCQVRANEELKNLKIDLEDDDLVAYCYNCGKNNISLIMRDDLNSNIRRRQPSAFLSVIS